MIRALLKRDISQIKRIHENHFKEEFSFDEMNRFICSFVSVDSADNIICAGGIRSIAEIIMVTDKSQPLEKRLDSFHEMLKAAGLTTQSAGYSHLHAFIQDEKWKRHLMNHGFQKTAGEALIIKV